MYQIYDCTDDKVVCGNMDFEEAKEYIAEPWMEDDEEHYDRVLASGSMDQLNHYAEGLGYIVERMDNHV